MIILEIIKEDVKIVGFETNTSVPSGSSLQGTITATFQELQTFFGPPITDTSEPDKVRAMWEIEVRYQDDLSDYADDSDYDSAYLYIYDWKESQQLEHVTRWNVGSDKNKADWILEDLLAALRAR